MSMIPSAGFSRLFVGDVRDGRGHEGGGATIDTGMINAHSAQLYVPKKGWRCPPDRGHEYE